jgi:hypothetical protein
LPVLLQPASSLREIPYTRSQLGFIINFANLMERMIMSVNLEEVDHKPHRFGKLSRLESLGDAIFAFALTLLALDIRLPEIDPAALARGILALLPKLLIFVLAFLVIAQEWDVYQRQHCLSLPGLLGHVAVCITFRPAARAGIRSYNMLVFRRQRKVPGWLPPDRLLSSTLYHKK